MSYPVASEADEQIALVQWMELVGLRFTSVPNSTFTTSWKQKTTNRFTGLRAGFPDLIVLVPPHRAKDAQGHMLCIEMKKTKGGTTSDVQKAWIAALNGLDSPTVHAEVCKGADEAMALVNRYLRPSPRDASPF